MEKFRFMLILVIIIISPTLFSQTQKIEISNNGFDNRDPNTLLPNWKAVTDSSVSLCSKSKRSGLFSLRMDHSDWQKNTIISDPVNLEIGQLYKLSAWIKTRDTETSPLDRYPTSVAGCITMESFPFTNHSASIGATTDWTQIEVQFIATKKTDRVRLHLGYNGNARGTIWFDDIELTKVEDISGYIPMETIRWCDKGFRYDDRGWIFVHIEGKPYERGYQYGYLVADEIHAYLSKLSIQANKDEPRKGWNDQRFIADAFMLRKYEKEYLEEMKGIADGVNKTGQKVFGREFDLIDIVTLNSAIDISYAHRAMGTTPNPLTGQNFLKSEDELNIPERLHKCSSFLANKSSTTDGRIVFGQIFMWGGYTGPHWNVICDIEPAKGHRLVYQTFPGGIHSGADFYINEAGIMIGETTVSQTPFNPDGSPQSNRIRKAAQYANDIDDVVDILTTNNNGMYANDWLIGDTKSDEIAVLLLGTEKHKLWRSSKKEFYGETKDFYWCNNNNKDPEVRKEYIPNKYNAPHDLIFTPWNRDIAFNKFYQSQKGTIDAIAGVNVWNSAPINRPHACDGKVTTSAMAEKLVFFANSGKVTLREKFVGENKRIPDLPGATPRLSLGYATFSPKFIVDKIKKSKPSKEQVKPDKKKNNQYDELVGKYNFDKRKLWFNTVYAASEAENWFVSSTAAYWHMLHRLPDKDEEIYDYFNEQFAELNNRYLYTTGKEGTLAAVNAQRIYTKYNNYQIPRIKGTFLLHQLRLYLGNELFSAVMNSVHEQYREAEMTSADFIEMAEKISGKDLDAFISQWIKRTDIPIPAITANVSPNGDKWKVSLTVNQPEKPYHFFSSVKIETEKEFIYKPIEIKGPNSELEFTVDVKPEKMIFNALNEIPLTHENFYTWSNFFDDFHSTFIVYGTKRQIEANHTLALRFSTTLADRYTEKLMPVVKDSEISEEEKKNNDLIILGNVEDNSLMQDIVRRMDLSIRKNFFSWLDTRYVLADAGLFTAFPNPYNPDKAVYLFNANSALELYQMTKDRIRMPSWAVYKNDKVIKKGYHPKRDYLINF